MDCQKAINLLSTYVDGSLPGKENRVIQEHLSACKACSNEFNLQKRLSGIMNSFNQDELQAPANLCGNIMGQIRQERKRVFYWMPPAWRKTIAAVAAILLMAGMSAGGIIGNMIQVATNGKVPSATPTTQVATNPSSDVSGQVKPVTDKVNQQNDTAQQPGSEAPPGNKNEVSQKENESGSVQNSNTVNSDTENNTGEILSKTAPPKTVTDSKAPASVAVIPSNEEKPVLLSSEMKVTSTILKVSVNDPAEARIKAVALSAGAGAITQVFPEQNGSKKILVMRLTTTTEQAPELIGGLIGLGTLVDRQDENRDITSSYNETSVQYANLQASISTSTDPEERKQLTSQAADLKKMLDSWKAEAGKRVFVLWLEEK